MHNNYLEFGFHVEDLLIKGLSVHSVGGMVGLCLCVAVFTFLYESVKTVREKLVSSLNKQEMQDANDAVSERQMLVEITESRHRWKRVRAHSVHALLYTLQTGMGYALMLVVMSCNAWLAITVFTAAGLAYWFYGAMVLHRPSVVPVEVIAPAAEYDFR